METPSKESMLIHQMSHFESILNEMAGSYYSLAKKRIFDEEMDRDKYMVYDMVDMLIHLNAALGEATKENIYPDYMVEKLSKVKSYIDTTLHYFEERAKK